MSRIIGLVLIVIVVIVLLFWFGFMGSEDEEIMDSTQGGVGEIIDEPGDAVEGDGDDLEIAE